MKKLVYLLVWIIGIGLGACSRQPAPVSVSYGHSFATDTSVCLFEVPLPCDIENITDMKLLRDNIILRSGLPGMDMFYVFRLPSMALEARLEEDSRLSGLSYGQNCLLGFSADSLYMIDWVDNRLSFVDKLPVPALPSMCLPIQLDRHTFLFNKPITQGALHEVYRYDSQTGSTGSFGTFPEDASRFKTLKHYQEAYRHYFSAKPDGSRLLEYYLFLRRVRIYGSEGDLQKDISIDYEPFEYVPSKNYLYIGGAWTTNERIYLLCTDRDMNASCPSGCSLVALDWDGRLLARYRLDHYLRFFFIDEKENVFYGVSSLENRRIFKFGL